MTRERSACSPNIEEVRTRFDRWRQTRQGKARIPDELWSAAIEVARRDGVNPTAAALHLDGVKLKRLMTTAVSVSGKGMHPAFVELIASGASGPPEYTLELEGHNGKLRIQCKGATTADLVSLSRALWDVAR